MARVGVAARQRPSLRAKALEWLARREYSRHELGRRLARWLDAERARETAGETATEAEIEPLLDELQVAGYLSDERFTESRIHARQARFGNRRIVQELREHGLSVQPEQQQALDDTELQRARAALQGRFAGVQRARGMAHRPTGVVTPETQPAEYVVQDAFDNEDLGEADPRAASEAQRQAEWKARARMQRFLLARGFTPETIRATLRGMTGDSADDADDAGD